MPSIALILTLVLASTQSIQAQVQTDQLATAATQFDNLSLSAPYPDGFGIPLKAQALLNVAYPSGPVSLGKSYSAEEVKTQPTITIVPLNSSAFKAPNVFTLMLADGNALGNPDKDGNYRHFLENRVTFGDVNPDGAMAMNAGSGVVVTSYAGPGPLPQTGVHRYAWMLFVQPSGFQAPSNLSAAGVGPAHWYVNSYVSSTGLGDLVAASFFTVQNGNASFPHNATIAHVSTPAAATQSATNFTGTTSAARNGATSGSEAFVWTGCAGIVKSIVMGLGVAVSGYVLVQ